LLAIPTADETLSGVRSHAQLPRGVVAQLEQFFVTYARLEGKDFRSSGRATPQQAMRRLAAEAHR
jgi:inorganic pyrophosphatase